MNIIYCVFFYYCCVFIIVMEIFIILIFDIYIKYILLFVITKAKH
jgi:hypothetical protein